MTAYYNENDPVAAEWLRRLVAAGLVTPGVVDERDIRDVTPNELSGFVQCHFFAGIGIWSGALRAASWPDDRHVWTGSCPCQPFSGAGRGDGVADERHLWPHWFHLVEQCCPDVLLGEQVAGKDGLGWNDLVSADLERAGYAFGSVNLCAAGFGMDWRRSAYAVWLERALHSCPDPMVARQLRDFAGWAGESLAVGGLHIRQRQYFVGLSDPDGQGSWARLRHHGPGRLGGHDAAGHCVDGRLADQQGRGRGVGGDAAQPGQGGHPDGSGDLSGRVADDGRRGLQPVDGPGGQQSAPGRHARPIEERQRGWPDDPAGGAPDGLDDPAGRGSETGIPETGERQEGHSALADHGSRGRARRTTGRPHHGEAGPAASEADGGRSPFDWLLCRDGSWRATRPGTLPLAHAVAGRVGKLRAYGNGLDFETATEFCRTVREMIDGDDL